MTHNRNSSAKPYLIVISGSVASGKSTIAVALSKALDNAPVLSFDHYEKYVQWPANLEQWMAEGCDPNQIRAPRLAEDLRSLLQWKTITDPYDGKTIQPAPFIILEEPSGRERQEICEFIDLVVYVNVPQDICVLRMIERTLNMPLWESTGTFGSESKEDLVRQLDSVALWTTQYHRARTMYVQISERVKANADLILNGLQPIERSVHNILDRLDEVERLVPRLMQKSG